MQHAACSCLATPPPMFVCSKHIYQGGTWSRLPSARLQIFPAHITYYCCLCIHAWARCINGRFKAVQPARHERMASAFYDRILVAAQYMPQQAMGSSSRICSRETSRGTSLSVLFLEVSPRGVPQGLLLSTSHGRCESDSVAAE